MLRFWKWLGYPAILTAALAVTPEIIRAADPEKVKDAPATAKDLEKIDKSLQKMGGDIARDIEAIRKDFSLHVQKTQADIDSLKAQVTQLRKDLDALRKGQPTVSGYGPAGKETDELRKQLDQVQQTLDAIRKQLPTTSTSLRPGGGSPSRIRLVNDYPFTNEFVVNGSRYVVEPGMVREVAYSPGAFTYRVPTLGIADQERVLPANWIYTIQVHPQ